MFRLCLCAVCKQRQDKITWEHKLVSVSSRRKTQFWQKPDDQSLSLQSIRFSKWHQNFFFFRYVSSEEISIMESRRNGSMTCQKWAFEMLQVFVTLPLTQIIVLSREAWSGVNCTKPTLLLFLLFFFLEHVLCCIGVYMYSFNKQNLSNLIETLPFWPSHLILEDWPYLISAFCPLL